MKIRSGFVSNSSSSSFVVVAPKKVVDKVLSEMDGYEQAVINFVKQNKTFVGIPVSVLSCMTGNLDSWEYGFDSKKEAKKAGIDPDETPSTYDVWDDFIEKLGKETTDYILNEESC